jgi:hypothetical protein
MVFFSEITRRWPIRPKMATKKKRAILAAWEFPGCGSPRPECTWDGGNPGGWLSAGPRWPVLARGGALGPTVPTTTGREAMGFRKQHTRGGKMWNGIGLAYATTGLTRPEGADECDGSQF